MRFTPIRPGARGAEMLEPILTELQIELAGICNIACSYCTWRDRESGKQLMDVSLARDLVEQASQLIPRPLVTFHGVGEATLHPNLRELLERADSYHLPIRLSTNCIALDTQMISWLGKLQNLGLSLALHQGVPPKTKKRAEGNALDFLASSPKCRMIEVLLVCDGQGAPQAERIVESFLPFVERVPQARFNLKQPQTWPRSIPIKGHIPGGRWEKHPQVWIDRVQTPCSLGRDCRMPEYLFNIQADGTTTLCCVGEENWGLPNMKGRKLTELWRCREVEQARSLWKEASYSLPCGHCKRRRDC